MLQMKLDAHLQPSVMLSCNDVCCT